MSFSILGYNESNRYDFHQFMIDTQQSYMETKRRSGQLTQRSRHILNDKFSSVFQNKYQELSARFDSVIDKAQIGFDDHRASLQDEQETVDQLMIHMSQTQQSQFTELISRLLINSEGIYQKWVKQEIVTLKEELQMIVIKNCEMQVEITQSYEQFEMVKERLDEEMNYRFQLQKHLVSLEKQLVIVKQENYQLHSSNKALLASKQHLDEQVQSTKIAQRDSSKSELIQKDRLNEEKQKTNQLEKENQLLTQRIMELENQLQEFRTQQQNFIQEIKHLSEIVENQSYELEFYKNRDFRQSPSAILQSYDKLNKYQDLIESYKKTNKKESLRGFMLSHQKSMGKLSIFEPRQSEERMFQKLSNPDFSLRSFELIQQSGMKLQQRHQNFNFSNFNQVTFRPQVDHFKSLLKDHHQSQSIEKDHVQFVVDCNLETDEKKNMQDLAEQYEEPKQICIESLRISSQKHLIQRSQSISQLHSSISKKLIYDQLNQDEKYNSKELLGEQLHKLQKEKSICGYSESHTKAHRQYLNSKFCNSRKHTETKTHIKKLSQDLKDNFDNRSETNSVNKALIKKNIKVQKEIENLQQKLQSAEQKLEQHQLTFHELQDQVKYYKHQLSKTAEITIRYKSEIQAYTTQIQMHENYRLEAAELVLEKNAQIQQKQEQIALLNQRVHQLNSSINHQKETFQERLLKVKQYCKTYIEQKHQTDIENLSYQYEQQINDLQQNLKIKSIKPLLINVASQTSKKSFSLTSIFHEKLYNLIIKQSQSMQTDSIFPQQTQSRQTETIISKSSQSMQTDSIFPQQTQSKQTETIISQSSQSMQTDSIKPILSFNFTVSQTIQPKIVISQSVAKRFELSLVVSEAFQGSNQLKESRCALFSVFSQKIQLQKANNALSQKFNMAQAFQMDLCETNSKKRQDLQKLSFIRVDSQNTYAKNRKQNLNFVNLISENIDGIKQKDIVDNISYHRVYSEIFNVQKNLEVGSRNLCLSPCFSLRIQRPILMKSPFLQKKKLLNTPSSLDSLQSKKQTTGCSRPSKKYDSNQSFCRSQISQLYQESVDVEESFYTVQFHKDLQHRQPDSFFTCIKFMNQTVRSEIQDHTDSQILNSQILDSQILKQEIFVAKKSIFVEQDQLASLETSEVLETVDQNLPKTILLKDDYNVKLQEQIIEPKKIMEYRQVPEIVRPRASSKHLKKSREPYFKVSLPGERKDTQEYKFYSNLFEKQLQPYFKKHTNFVFSQQVFPHGFIPNVQKMYLIHADSNQITDKKQLLPPNFPKRQRFLLYKRLLLDIESSKKLQIPKLSMFKFISDENKLVLGNFEIIINTDGELRITRKNKRCFYLGELDDDIWSIQNIEEINVICPPHKR